jgi:hypothetical protein
LKVRETVVDGVAVHNDCDATKLECGHWLYLGNT